MGDVAGPRQRRNYQEPSLDGSRLRQSGGRSARFGPARAEFLELCTTKVVVFHFASSQGTKRGGSRLVRTADSGLDQSA